MTDRMDEDIYRNGEPVAIIGDMPAKDIETLVQLLSERTRVQIDWSWIGGRAVVKALGDIEAARNAFRPYTNSWFKIIEKDGTWTG